MKRVALRILVEHGFSVNHWHVGQLRDLARRAVQRSKAGYLAGQDWRLAQHKSPPSFSPLTYQCPLNFDFLTHRGGSSPCF